jgi:leucyl-tRNA synthetase
MSKSRGNVVNPDEVIKQYGSDSFRMYEMFMGPFEASKPWDTKGIIGVFRFLNRVFQLVAGNLRSRAARMSQATDKEALKQARKSLHRAISEVTDDILAMRFNTAVSALMQCEGALANAALKVSRQDFVKLLRPYLVLVYPFAPHLASELWQYIGPGMIETQSWPRHNPKLIAEDMTTYAIQVNGKLRHTLRVLKSLSQDEVVGLARKSESVKKWLQGKTVRKTIFVPHKIVNFVV